MPWPFQEPFAWKDLSNRKKDKRGLNWEGLCPLQRTESDIQ